MKNWITQTVIGGSGIGVIEVVKNTIPSDPTDVVQATNIIVQIIIAIATLFGIFKRKKQKN